MTDSHCAGEARCNLGSFVTAFSSSVGIPFGSHHSLGVSPQSPPPLSLPPKETAEVPGKEGESNSPTLTPSSGRDWNTPPKASLTTGIIPWRAGSILRADVLRWNPEQLMTRECGTRITTEKEDIPTEERPGGSFDPFVISWKQQSHAQTHPWTTLKYFGSSPSPFLMHSLTALGTWLWLENRGRTVDDPGSSLLF